MTSVTPPALSPLEQSVQFVRGVGPARAELLAKLEIFTVEDLLLHLPRDVLDLTHVKPIFELVEGELQTVRGVVVDRDSRLTSTGKTMTAILLQCDGGYARGVWFNQPWMLQKFQDGQRVLFSAAPKFRQKRWEFSHPRVQFLEEDDTAADGGLIPRYRLTEGLKLHELRRMIQHAVEDAVDLLPDPWPEALRTELQLPRMADAVRQLHQPATMDEYRAGLRRVLYEDLLEFQLGIALRRRYWRRENKAVPLPVTSKIDARIRRLFPFQLTAGQDQAIRDIAGDLGREQAMHRLLQADVGAGKTAVAVYAMLAAVAAGQQAVVMAPTEVLAQQHWQTIERLLAQSRVERRLLTGQLTAAERRETLAGIRSGAVQLVVGTQAIIQKDVEFAKLGLVVIDEQHKFGVMQRAKFASGETTPHVLVMTATPIPRSLCLTQFGDLDLTSIHELPPGRQKVVTSRISGPGAERKVWEFLRGKLAEGRQLYVVCPRVEAELDNETPALSAAAEQVFRNLSAGELKDFRVGLLHGQLGRDQRADVMERFRAAELDALVATTVIEVGVDVPNATLMVILQAERFGLSQLHQLRGRIGRGRFQGYCFLFSSVDQPDAVKRLATLEASADGFQIAQTDLELRGGGDVLGTRQHGALPLKVADLVRDQELLEEARTKAFELVDSGRLDRVEFGPLKQRVLERFRQLMDLPVTG